MTKKIYLKDYQPPEYLISTVTLFFDLHEEYAEVRNTLQFQKNPESPLQTQTLNLSGEGLSLKSLRVDGRLLTSDEYSLIGLDSNAQTLNFKAPSNSFSAEIITTCEPQKNLSFNGLYKSNGMFCTQCEAEGFRAITYFQDRPDVLATYDVTIEADQKLYPRLLSNGNLIESRTLPNGRHQARWHDPFKKPCYLFALVAGDLAVIEDTFKTMSGREVKLQIFSTSGHQDRCQHAMQSLKLAMRWDEQAFGREYDLDIFMIVAVDDFNMGAMENKGLNIFNSSYVLAKPETATDTDYDNILAVVGHEYFHNWTGNRITCRDWFQLSLKEGLTVFRDQQFSMAMGSAAVHRISDVNRLRTYQFPEDAGPMSHPIRPASFISIDNFYTATVYEKGAEVIRMMHTILGEDGFRKGMDLYFKRHDGQAVTTEHFVASLKDANDLDLSQFEQSWYNNAGTPVVEVKTDYDEARKTFRLHLSQDRNPPFDIPIAMGLLNSSGHDLFASKVLRLKESAQTFEFTDVPERPVVSLLRGFSAPVQVKFEPSDADLAFLMAHDSDAFSRWEAGQKLMVRSVLNQGTLSPEVLAAFGVVIRDTKMDLSFKALMLTLPTENYLHQFFSEIQVEAVFAAREKIARTVAEAFEHDLFALYSDLNKLKTAAMTPQAAKERALKNRVLDLLTKLEKPLYLDAALAQAATALNMTDELGALAALNHIDCGQREAAFKHFYSKWQNESLVMNKWLALQAVSSLPKATERVRQLAKDPVFDNKNPNKIYSLFGQFGNFNSQGFHDPSGAGYKFMADQILDIDSRNPQVASRLVSTFNQWKRFDPQRRQLMQQELARIKAHPGLSTNVLEIVDR
jgi:aminopeptidase N